MRFFHVIEMVLKSAKLPNLPTWAQHTPKMHPTTGPASNNMEHIVSFLGTPELTLWFRRL